MEVKNPELEKSKSQETTKEEKRENRQFCTLSDSTIDNLLEVLGSICDYKKYIKLSKIAAYNSGYTDLAEYLCKRLCCVECSAKFIVKFLSTCGYNLEDNTKENKVTIKLESLADDMLKCDISISNSINNLLEGLLVEKDLISYSIIGDSDLVEHRQEEESISRRAADIWSNDFDMYKKGKLLLKLVEC